MRILLLNPPIYDFSAYDFWLKPFGLLRVAGYLRNQAELVLYDSLDRLHPTMVQDKRCASDLWGRGKFLQETVSKPPVFEDFSRNFRRFGLPRASFQTFLQQQPPFDVALVQTMMSYWYPGVQEVLEDLRRYSPQTKIVLGGVYATLCPEHARSLGAELVIEGLDLDPLWNYLQRTPDLNQLPYWEGYPRLETGILKLADGCPFRCTYCSVPQIYPDFEMKPISRSLQELDFLVQQGVRHIAFYDDAILHQSKQLFLPFLKEVLQRKYPLSFHTPNALNARFITEEIATLMVRAGFKTFHLGFESAAYEWQRKTGSKVYTHEFVQAVRYLKEAGADPRQIVAYFIIGHPEENQQDINASLELAHETGVQLMLSEFSPLPGTPDGEACRKWVSLEEPLWHNKTIFTLIRLGEVETQRLKTLCRQLNQEKSPQDSLFSTS
ncbi:MAG: B12-binding domain-containing radical SAM protein [Planctomycetota bacterium]